LCEGVMDYNSKSITIECAGNLTIASAKETRTTISTALYNSNSVVIDCSSATDVDITFIQLLISTQRTAAAMEKDVSLVAPVDGALAAALARTGLALSNLSGASVMAAQ
ncbi:MAG: STAS domain-containing protein, partial [Methylovirgula sp.]